MMYFYWYTSIRICNCYWVVNSSESKYNLQGEPIVIEKLSLSHLWRQTLPRRKSNETAWCGKAYACNGVYDIAARYYGWNMGDQLTVNRTAAHKSSKKLTLVYQQSSDTTCCLQSLVTEVWSRHTIGWSVD